MSGPYKACPPPGGPQFFEGWTYEGPDVESKRTDAHNAKSVARALNAAYAAGRAARDDELNHAARQFTDEDGEAIIHAELTEQGWEVERPWGDTTYAEFTDLLDEAGGRQ